jgi:NAD(P)-dependent dehydrogenase (short-subunit alcohol dehydrogenase family)
MVDLLGTVSVVTGATRGLGLATATALAQMGSTVVLLGRDGAGGKSAEIRAREAAAPGADVEFIACDLSSIASVTAAAAEVAAKYPAINVLINNAGIHLRSRESSVDGFEMTWAVNHLGPFLLTNQLLPQLRAVKRSRIVTVTSQFARLGRVVPSTIGTKNASSGLRAYCDTKLANMMVTRELARRFDKALLVANCVHPGLVATDLMREWGVLRWTWEWALRSPADGAMPIVRLAALPTLGEVSGGYYVRLRRAPLPRRARNDEVARALWEESERLVGLV